MNGPGDIEAAQLIAELQFEQADVGVPSPTALRQSATVVVTAST